MNRGRALGPGRLDKRNGRWVLAYTDAGGRRRRKVLGTDRRTAERLRTEIIHRRDLERAGLGAEAGQGATLAEFLDQYLADLKPRVTPRHYHNVQGRLRHVVDLLDGLRVADLKPLHAVQIRNRAVAEGRSHRTANLLVDRLAAMLRWAEENELVGRNPLTKLRRLPETRDHQRYRRRALTEAEIECFLAAAEADDERNGLEAGLQGWTRVPQTPMWVGFLETGARWSELRRTTWGDVDLGRRILVLKAENTKSKKQRAVPLREGLTGRLRGLQVVHADILGRVPTIADLVFLSPEGAPWKRPTTNCMRIFDRLLVAAGIPKIDGEGRKLDLHALRHTAGTRLARAGVGLVQTQRLLGHSDPKLTAQVYTHLDVEDLRGSVESLPSLDPGTAAIGRRVAGR